MKILQVIPTLEAGGTETFISNLSIEISKGGGKANLFVMSEIRGKRGSRLKERLSDNGVTVICGEKNVRDPRIGFALWQTITKSKPDIIQANLYPAEVMVAANSLIVKRKGTLLANRIPGTDIFGYRNRSIVKAISCRFDLTIACSKSVARVASDLLPESRRKKTVTIRNGCVLQNQATTETLRKKARNQYGVNIENFVFCHVGRMVGGKEPKLEQEPKAQDTLLKAFQHIATSNSAVSLMLVGDGPLRPKLEALAKNLRIDKQVYFLGKIEEPWPAYQAADCFVLPSRAEGMPNVLPEAASCGLPIIASKIDTIKEIAEEYSWDLVEPDDVGALAAQMNNAIRSAEVKRQSAESEIERIAQSFSMKKCADEYLATFERTILANASEKTIKSTE